MKKKRQRNKKTGKIEANGRPKMPLRKLLLQCSLNVFTYGRALNTYYGMLKMPGDNTKRNQNITPGGRPGKTEEIDRKNSPVPNLQQGKVLLLPLHPVFRKHFVVLSIGLSYSVEHAARVNLTPERQYGRS